MRSETAPGGDLELYRRTESVLNASIARAQSSDAWTLVEDEMVDVERVLVVHDEQLAAIPKHRYLAVRDRLQRFISGTGCSPISSSEKQALMDERDGNGLTRRRDATVARDRFRGPCMPRLGFSREAVVALRP